MTIQKSRAFGIALGCCLIFVAGAFHWADCAENISVRAMVEKETVALGESFMFQIEVEGNDLSSSTTPLDMSPLKDFTVESMGNRSNSSSSITIINGQMNKVETHGYVMSYRLTPKKLGQTVIPSLSVPVGSQVFKTEPIALQVVQPETTQDFHLKVSFSKTRFYTGEPILMTVTWYLAKGIKDFTFHLPILENPSVTLSDPEVDQNSGQQYYQIPLGQGSAIAQKGTDSFNGRDYTTLSFTKVLSASKPGVLEIPESTISCKALAGFSRTQRRRNSSPFDDFFNNDFFGSGIREVYKTFVARSEPVSLTVLPLPEEGKPDDFSGCIGHFHIEVTATPTQVSVGDPITLTTSIRGSDYLENVQLPPLSKNAELAKDFKIPNEMAAGIVKDGAKVFTQTVRAKTDTVTAIPPLRFAYFDPDLGKYQVAQSRMIPIEVKATRIVTASDAEGPASPAVKNELEAWSQGIAYNYEGPDVLENQRIRFSSLIRSPLWMGALLLPFSIYLVLLLFVRMRQERIADPDKFRSKKAFTTFKQNMKTLGKEQENEAETYEHLLRAIRSYLGDKLKIEGAALTFKDAQEFLKDKGVDTELIQSLEELFSRCEQGRYGGGSAAPEFFDALESRAFETIQALERKI